MQNDYNNIQLQFISEGDELFYVLADKKQILRVFNNLIKNSIQAIGHNKEGWIRISVEEKLESFIVKVIDNGSGISKDQGEKIFIPSFTTKTSGMGLGLSMVRSIIVSAGGNITYTSEPGKETTFIISLPRYKGI